MVRVVGPDFAQAGVGAGSASDGADAVEVGAEVGALDGCAGAVKLGVGARSADESARAAESVDNETKAAAPIARADVQDML